MRSWFAFVLIGLMLLVGCQGGVADADTAVETVVPPATETPEAPADPLAGTWRLLSWEMRLPDGQAVTPYGPNPVGLLMYDGAGHMTAHVVAPDRPDFASDDLGDATLTEKGAAFSSYLTYFGDYSVDLASQTVTHTLTASLFPNWVNDAQVRHYELDGNQLTLTAEPMLAGGAEVVQALVWERVAP